MDVDETGSVVPPKLMSVPDAKASGGERSAARPSPTDRAAAQSSQLQSDSITRLRSAPL